MHIVRVLMELIGEKRSRVEWREEGRDWSHIIHIAAQIIDGLQFWKFLSKHIIKCYLTAYENSKWYSTLEER